VRHEVSPFVCYSMNYCHIVSNFSMNFVQLRYYDSSDDQTVKGAILLADAVEILPYTGPFPNALRRFDSRAAFEVRKTQNK
jgi:hypothetical protein